MVSLAVSLTSTLLLSLYKEGVISLSYVSLKINYVWYGLIHHLSTMPCLISEYCEILKLAYCYTPGYIIYQ